MRPIVQTRQLVAGSNTSVAQDQQLAAAGDLAIDGTLAVDGVAQLGSQRQVRLESSGNISATNFTITGTDESGAIISETLAGPNATTIATELNFSTVTQIAADSAFASDIEVGTNNIGASQTVPLDQYLTPFNASLSVVITGTVDVTVEFTFDDVFGDFPGPHSWIPHPDLTNITADADATFISPVSACRLLTNSGDGEAVLRIIQAGTQ